ncbi:MAG: type III pantothenate kinase [Sedimentisphaerales bacterium]|nr:type III pantothenate kinase [Sedimentisphaerales bacterium]
MNIMAIDIGNSKIAVGLFLDGQEQFIKRIPGQSTDQLRDVLIDGWARIPAAASSKEGIKDGVIVGCSVKPAWTKVVEHIVKTDLGQSIKLIGRDLPLPMPVWLDDPNQVGPDRVVAAAAAYDVVEDAVVVADFGTAVTIDLVDRHGVFQGGVIMPGFEICLQGLYENTALLPKVVLTRPTEPWGRNTADAIRCGIYYGAIGALEEIVRRYAERIGSWPQVIMTGSGGELIYQDCPFVDNYVPNLVVKGIVLAYRKYLQQKASLQ